MQAQFILTLHFFLPRFDVCLSTFHSFIRHFFKITYLLSSKLAASCLPLSNIPLHSHTLLRHNVSLLLAMSTATRCLTRSYAIADLNDMESVSTVNQPSDRLKKRKATDEGIETDPVSVPEDFEPPATPPKRKRGRPKGSKNKGRSDQQTNSDDKLGHTDSPMSPPKPSKRGQAPPPRSPLPPRVKRVINPGKPDAKKAKRSSAEVAEAKKRKEDLRRLEEEYKKKKIQMMAKMEMQEEMDAAEEEENAVNHWDNITDEGEDVVEEEPAAEASGFGDDRTASDADVDEEPKRVPVKKAAAPVCLQLP